ncbi:MAG TPA: 1-deoxy-D-xylulose-5-phosphate synthase [Bacteroidales bacterium]|jgi:1-deoxy-D-xylulose-5-phosphate synthase|nr:1-deoxy-D-xylulose-5-phosphate synthase [Bacteroidales bacterium]MCZ2415961.1 1-deoxy-D-xylulose-5-phosphate synthase [Burkholderiales bacterium]OQC57626.1 MAG: 1-deoxy-D-xylulose-5-phosphate synthase [Bacteroidetes bacterium ADurb.Bin013]MBP8999001.1 1-deoxy-D-xylulose-5-phosphate synthase [Bacteroidales bacterium]MBV6455297.1 1-deoxy-D-xylulose-5-phosphate synthase [Bacteroidales bacterium]
MDNLIEQIDSPEDLKKLKPEQLPQLCAEIRKYITECCSHNPGHLGASLGTVELTVALHYVYDAPKDKIIWDVGHQAYTHKILTGRRKEFLRNRCYNGLSGFPKMDESPYDAFGTGHSSTSISAALGYATAAAMRKSDEKTVAVIGDGSMTAGLAYEGLNNAGGCNADMLIVLNDNKMSIEPNVGGLHNSLLKLTTSGKYNRLKMKTWKALGSGTIRDAIQETVKAGKRLFVKNSTLFQPLGIRYFGPVDGHDVILLVNTFKRLKNLKGPRLLHALTIKGKGYAPAENDQPTWHAPGLFDAETGHRLTDDDPDVPTKTRFQDVFGQTLLELARTNPDITGITPAMPSGCSMNLMMEEMPHRCFDVGIAEQHAVTFSAGLAAAGFLPYCNIYSSFMQRAYDSVIHDVAIQNLKVVFCLDRGGLVGEDGVTHHGAYDLAYLNCVPGLIVAAPMDEVELRNMMYSAQDKRYTATSIRYPRGTGAGIKDWRRPFQYLEPGRARLLSQGKDMALLSLGAAGIMGAAAVAKAAEKGISVQHYDMRFLKPIDGEVLEYVSRNFSKVITLEDGCLIGGLHSTVSTYLARHKEAISKVTGLGIPDRFIQHGKTKQLYHECGYDTESILQAIIALAG